MWVGSMTLEYVNYIPCPLNKVGIFIKYSYIHIEVKNLGGVILMTLCNAIHNITIIKNINTIHNILTNHIDTIHYLYWR